MCTKVPLQQRVNHPTTLENKEGVLGGRGGTLENDHSFVSVFIHEDVQGATTGRESIVLMCEVRQLFFFFLFGRVYCR